MWLALTNAANAATTPRDESRLELFFGVMAGIAVVTMLLWLWFRTRKPTLQPTQGPQDA